MNYKDKAQDIYTRLIESSLAMPSQIKGCTEEEIIFLEHKYNIILPDSYKLFLRIFGHGHGHYMMEDLDILYDRILSITDFVNTRVFTERNKPDMLPSNIFVFASRYREQFFFFDTDLDEEDPPYYYYYWDNDEEIVKYDESMWCFIESELMIVEK
jgi:SMI1 / KNR4 family (SUKH-1)